MKWTQIRLRLPIFWVWFCWITAILWPTALAAHGNGTPQLVNTPAGPYHLSVWTQPEPLRVGEAHFSIAVEQPAVTSQALDDEVAVQLMLAATEPAGRRIVYHTTRQTRLFQVYYEVDFLLSTEGTWRATVLIDGEAGYGEVPFTFSVLPKQHIGWTAISWGLLALFALIGIIWAQRGTDQSTRRDSP